jgi:hypothetical protein
VAYTLRDGPPPDGIADDLIVPPDTNYGRVFHSTLFDSEFAMEFIMTGAEMAQDVNLTLTLTASVFDLVHGESKTFEISAYQGSGVASLATFGAGAVIESVTLATNGIWSLDVDVTDLWNAGVVNGDDFFGIRIHDPVWTGTLIGASTITVDSAALEGVPEPEMGPLVGAGVLILVPLAAERTRRRSGKNELRFPVRHGVSEAQASRSAAGQEPAGTMLSRASTRASIAARFDPSRSNGALPLLAALDGLAISRPGRPADEPMRSKSPAGIAVAPSRPARSSSPYH